MTNEKVKEVLELTATSEITEELPWKIKAVCHKHAAHVFVCNNKNEYEKYLMSEFTEEELAEMTEDEKIEIFKQNWFAVSFANEDLDDIDTEEYHGGIILFAEDFLNMQNMFKEEIDDDLLREIIYNAICHELGHIVHRTGDECIADRYSIKKTDTSAFVACIKYMLFYFKKKSHGAMKRYTDEYDHRNVVLGL